MAVFTLNINGEEKQVDVDPGTLLLWVLRDHLKLYGTKYGWMIRMSDAPKSIDVHFVENEIDPTGMGEPPFPPVFGALANAIYKATGKRRYDQPFMHGGFSLG